MISGWAKSVLGAWRRPTLLVNLVNALLLALGCGNTESNPKKDEPAENVPVGSQCQRYPLSDYCATRTCPINQTEAEAAARNLCASAAGARWYRQATACGGAAVGGIRGYEFFDAAGELIGITFSSDIGSNGCGQDVPGMGKTTIYGKACALTGEATELCMP
jgi:hypothetical protein